MEFGKGQLKSSIYVATGGHCYATFIKNDTHLIAFDRLVYRVIQLIALTLMTSRKARAPDLRMIATLKLGNKTAKTNPEKAQLFAESVERNFGIESHLFSKSQFDRINKFVEAHSYHFTPLDSLYDNITDTDDDSDLVADVDPDTLIRIVRTELKNGKASGTVNVYNIILKKAIGTGFYKVLARAFTISLKLGFIPHVWKIAVLCMLIKPDKPPSQTTSYRSISLLSAIMKLLERVIEKRLRKHLEDNGFLSFSKY